MYNFIEKGRYFYELQQIQSYETDSNLQGKFFFQIQLEVDWLKN
jgi:hypothetical protein